MTNAELAVEQLTGLTEEVGTGIFMKQLDNGRQVFSCKCPVCGTIHGGFRSYAEADAHKKCREHFRKEIEKTRKEVEKVDEPKKQKDIFQNRLNKPAVIGEAEDDLEDTNWKDVTAEHMDYPYAVQVKERLKYPATYFITDDGNLIEKPAGVKLIHHERIDRMSHTYAGQHFEWPEIKAMLDSGKSFTGYIWFKLGDLGWNAWEKKVTVRKTKQSPVQEDADVVAILTGDDPESGAVNKMVCENARLGQDFWHRHQRHADGSPIRVQVSGKCLKWESKPNEFKLPVRYGLFQTLYITEHNATDFTTACPGDGGRRGGLRRDHSGSDRAPAGRSDHVATSDKSLVRDCLEQAD